MAETAIQIAEQTVVYTPNQLRKWLIDMISRNIDTSIMIWGPPGIGKSSIIKQVADHFRISLVDVRVSQLAPTDLRGLPVPDDETRTAQWFPPEFLPSDPQSKGILFLDEFNMATPVVQGIAQQLILDRKVGSYTVPPGWIIISAGNEKKDKAAVFEMTLPLSNRFLHIHVGPNLASFNQYAYEQGVSPFIPIFLQVYPALLHRLALGEKERAWPSPRSWFAADKLFSLFDTQPFGNVVPQIAPAVGTYTANKFRAFVEGRSKFAAVQDIVLGDTSSTLEFPSDPKDVYVLMAALISAAIQIDETSAEKKDEDLKQIPKAINAVRWFLSNIDARARSRGIDQKFIVNLHSALSATNRAGIFQDLLQKSGLKAQEVSQGAIVEETLASQVESGLEQETGLDAFEPARDAYTVYTAGELTKWLRSIFEKKIALSVMIWGPPGIGKSSVVQQVGRDFTPQLEVIDVRVSQLAPSDLRGLPVPDRKNRLSRWYPPEFLPKSGDGILFLDEFNMATPAVQGIAQQLLLDREVGSYKVPDGWFILAAGNEKKDKASVFEMTMPLANRFLHLHIGPNLKSFLEYAYEQGISPFITAFLLFRPALLHAPSLGERDHAWPSPRSWFAANQIFVKLDPEGSGTIVPDIAPAVGTSTAREFRAFVEHRAMLPDVQAIVRGQGASYDFPSEISVQYALLAALIEAAIQIDDDPKQADIDKRLLPKCIEAVAWLYDRAFAAKRYEFLQIFVTNLRAALSPTGRSGMLMARLNIDKKTSLFMKGDPATGRPSLQKMMMRASMDQSIVKELTKE